MITLEITAPADPEARELLVEVRVEIAALVDRLAAFGREGSRP